MNNVSSMLAAAANEPIQSPGNSKVSAMLAGLPEQKQQEVGATADAKRVALGGIPDDDTFTRAAITRRTGAGLSSSNQIEQDLATLPYEAIPLKYGAAGHAMVSKLLDAERGYAGLTSGVRSRADMLSDSLKGAALGAADMVGGIGALGLSGLDAIGRQVGADTHMGVLASQGVKALNEAVEGSESPLLQHHRDANEQKSALQARDNALKGEEDRANGDSGLVSGLKEIGRNLVDNVGDTLSDPTMALDSASNAAGSLFGMGPIAKGVGLISEKVLPTAMKAGMNGPWNRASEQLAAAVGTKLPSQEAAATGLMFGGGSYQGTAAQIASMSPDDLAKLPPYQALIAKGLSPEDARAQLADQAGHTAALVAAPAGVLAGALAKNVIRNPLGSKTAQEGGENILASTTEQGLQGGAGQLANNVGIQQNVDPDQPLTQGVGEAIGSGVVGGLGVGAALQAPSLVGHGVKAAGKAGADAFKARLDTIKTENAKASPISNEKIAAAGEAAQEISSSEPVVHALKSMVETAHEEDANAPEDAPKRGPEAERLADQLQELGHFDPSEIEHSNLPASVKAKVGDATHRVDMMQKLADVVNDKGVSSEDGLAAAFHLYGEISKFRAFTDNPAIHDIPKDDPAKGIVDAFAKLGANVGNSPKIMEAMTAVHNMSEAEVTKMVTKPSDVATLAAISPDKPDLRSVQIILDNYDKGKVKLTADQHSALLAAQAVLSASKSALDTKSAWDLSKPITSVSKDVMTREGTKEDTKRSASAYAKRVFEAVQTGNLSKAKSELSDFGGFVDHMSNKSDAANESYERGDGSKANFEARNPDTGDTYQGIGPGVHGKNKNSVELAQQVNIEAKQLSDVYNGLSRAFPQLNAGQKEVKDLHPNLQGKPSEIAQAHSKGDLKSPMVPRKVADTSTDRDATRKEATVPSEPRKEEKPKEQEAKPEQLDKKPEVEPEATPGVKSEPQAQSSDEGAKGKADKLEEALAPEHEKLSSDMQTAGKSDSYNDPKVRKDLADRLDKLSDEDFVKVFEHSFNGNVTLSDLKPKSDKAVQGLLDQFTKQLGLKDVDTFIRMVKGYTDTSGKDLTGKFYTDGPVIGIAAKDLSDFESGKVPIEYLRHIVSHELTHAIDLHASDNSLKSSHDDAKFNIDGDLYKEFSKLKDAKLDKTSRPVFDYIEKQTNPKSKAEEFFAELGAFVLSEPKLAQELIPNGTKAFNEILERAKANRELWANDQRSSDQRTTAVSAEGKLRAPERTESRDSTRNSEPGSKPEPKSVAEAYPDLVHTGTDKNWFHNAFTLVKEGANRLLGSATPYRDIQRALSSQEALSAFLGDSAKQRRAALTPEIADAYKTHLSYLPEISKTMEAQLQDKLSQGTNVEKLLAGEANRWKDGRALNFVEQNPDGSFSYNKPLLEQSIMAALQWVLVADRAKTIMDADKVSKLTGIPAGEANGLVDMLDFGLSSEEASHSLAQKLTDFWGVKAKTDIGNGFTQGIPLAMAGELLEALHGTELAPGENNPADRALLRITRFAVDGNTLTQLEHGEETKKRTIGRITTNMVHPDSEEEKANSVFSAPTLIEEAVLRDSPDKNYHESDTVPVATKQMNNPNIANTSEQKAMISKVQNVLHYLDEHTFNLYKALGSDNQERLFGGGGDTKDRALNEQHELSLRGKNTSVSAAWQSVVDRVSELQTMPKKLQTGMKFAYNVSSIGRLQMLGGYNSQGSKGIREVITPTWNTVDLRTKEGKGNPDDNRFWNLALAQGLGIKIHQLMPDVVDTKLQEKLSQFKDSIELLQDHLNGVTDFTGDKLTEALQREFTQSGVEPTYVALKALTEHARWLDASDEERANFKTSIYVEADGVTNGVNNAMHLFTADTFNADQIENYKRGGRFYDGTKTTNEYRSGKDTKDLYGIGSDHLQKATDKLRASLAGSPVQAQLDHVANVLRHFADGVNYDLETHQITTERGVIKNPMTIVTYGAGLPGIAGNIADVVVRSFYEKLSKAMQAFRDNPNVSDHEALLGKGSTPEEFKSLMTSLNALISHSVSPKGDELWRAHNGKDASSGKRVYTQPVDLSAKSFDPKTFKFSPEQFKAIQDNILKLFIQPMKQGIDETLGHSMMDSTQLTIRANQAQSIVQEHMFRDAIKELYADKKKNVPGWKPTDGVSQDEINHVLKGLREKFPLLTPKGQIFDPTGNNMSEVANTPSSSLSGKFSANPRIHGPSNGGVSSLAKLNIGEGDGNTIQKAVVKHGLPSKSLEIFDGVNLNLKDIANGSEILNKSVLEAQQGNPLRDTLNSFEVFMSHMSSKILEKNPEMLKDISSALSSEARKAKTSLDPQEVMEKLHEIHDELNDKANMVDLRHQVESEFESHTDNMAGAMSPYKNKGKSLEGRSSQEIADAMNKRLEELQKGIKSSPTPTPEQPTIADTARGVSGMASRTYGDDPRLSELNATFNEMFTRFLKPNDPVTNLEHQTALQNSIELKKMAEANGNGFQMTQQARDTFDHVVSALSLNMKLDPNALSAIDDLYKHVAEKLTPEMLENKNDPSQVSRENIAQTKYQMIMGHLGTKFDKEGRSSFLSTFLGLSLVDDGFRKALSNIQLPESKFNDAGTADAIVRNKANQVMDALTNKLSGAGDAQNVRDAIDNLTRRVGERALDARETQLQQALSLPNTVANRANDAFTGWIERVTDKLRDKTQSVRDNTNSPSVKHAADFTNMLAGLVTEKNAAHASEGIMSAINRVKGWEPIREMVSDMVGRTKSNGSVYDMIKASNSVVSKLRQEFRDNLPKIIAGEFSRKLTDPEWAHLHQMGKSDLASLREGRTNQRVLELLTDPRERRSEARSLEAQLKAMDPKHTPKVLEKAAQLAEHMMNGTHGTNLLMNAESVSHLNGERSDPKRTVTPAYTKLVDHLTTLYALDKMSKETQKSLTSLVQSESKGMEFALSYLVGTRKDEVAKATGMAKYMALKGYTPEMREEGSSLIVANDRESSMLLEQSYTRIGDYHGSDAERNYESKGYYYAPVSGRAAFNQGIIQNAAHTSGGVEIGTGRSQGLTAGRITSRALVYQITRNLKREGATTENLRAIYNDRGRVVAYERMVDPTRLQSVMQDAHLARSLGAWRGRQVEESMTEEFNKGLIDKTKEMYDESVKKGNEKEYEDLFQSKDKIVRDAVSLFTPQTREYARQVFGDSFMVRKDMLNDTTGYRQATVGDAWTGNTRWNQEYQDGVKNLAMSVFGNKAYAHMVNSENFAKAVVKEAKTLIVVKSIIVPISNFTSNLFQLAARGVPITTMIRDMPRKVAEAETYSKGRLALIRAEADLRAAQGSSDPRSLNDQVRLKTKIQSINDSFTRLSIWPLIKAGEFSAISHSDMSNDDLKLVGGKLHDYMSTLVDKLPASVQSAGKYALITKDTALFQGLAKAVEYGDFLGKALQYDHWVNKKGFTEKEALARVTEEYVNFDRLPGRARGYLDSMGLMWFMNFKLRTTKVALSMIRENPVQALLGTMVPTHHYGVGTPFSDNIIAKLFSGHLGYSLGPGMMLHAPMLNPVAHVLSKM